MPSVLRKKTNEKYIKTQTSERILEAALSFNLINKATKISLPPLPKDDSVLYEHKGKPNCELVAQAVSM